jgi:hypothetical protein
MVSMFNEHVKSSKKRFRVQHLWECVSGRSANVSNDEWGAPQLMREA